MALSPLATPEIERGYEQGRMSPGGGLIAVFSRVPRTRTPPQKSAPAYPFSECDGKTARLVPRRRPVGRYQRLFAAQPLGRVGDEHRVLHRGNMTEQDRSFRPN